MHKVNFNSQCTVGNLLYELNCMLIHRSPTPQWLQRKIDFDRLLHDKLTDYTGGSLSTFMYNHIRLLCRSDFTAVFLFIEGEL